jgi:hypothetical protein
MLLKVGIVALWVVFRAHTVRFFLEIGKHLHLWIWLFMKAKMWFRELVNGLSKSDMYDLFSL